MSDSLKVPDDSDDQPPPSAVAVNMFRLEDYIEALELR
jgi:hypothetical protein